MWLESSKTDDFYIFLNQFIIILNEIEFYLQNSLASCKQERIRWLWSETVF